jgi:hypothetical protein
MSAQKPKVPFELAFRWEAIVSCAAFSNTWARHCFAIGFLLAALLAPIGASAQTGICRVTHIDYHERRALQSVAALIRTPYVLSSYPYVPASSAQRRLGQSEAARIAPDIVSQSPDVVVVHGSTFTGSADLRLVLGELIRLIEAGWSGTRGFVIYSSARINAATLAINGPLRDKLRFMDAPIPNRFKRDSASARELQNHVKQLCGL